MKRLLYIIVLSLIVYQNAFALSPTSVKIKLYKMAVSASVLCTNPITVYENANPEYTDMVAGPTFGTVSLADGNYPCVILEFSDHIKYIPEATSGSCTSGQEYTAEICRTEVADPVRLIDGTQSTCADGEQRVALWLSTTVVDSGNNNAFARPASIGDNTNGFNLGAALVVAGEKVGTFVIDFTDQLSGANPECDCNAPLFSFR
jgi:hypothetical protein